MGWLFAIFVITQTLDSMITVYRLKLLEQRCTEQEKRIKALEEGT